MSREQGLDKRPAGQDEGNVEGAASISVVDVHGPATGRSGTDGARMQRAPETCPGPTNAHDVTLPQTGGAHSLPLRIGTDVKPALACMHVSDKGLKVIQFYEGLKLQPYVDTGGRSAIGYGHHIREGEDFSKGINKARADRLLLKDLKVARFHVADKVAVPLNQGQYDALVSFVYNVGSENFAGSTLLRKLNSGDYAGAANEFHKWNRAGKPGKVMRGLTHRREAEKTLFSNM